MLHLRPRHRLARLVAPAKAQTQALPTTDLLLVLAVDASGSVNQTRFELQRRGYADAFRSQQVLNAIRGGSTGSIAVTMTQWTGPAMQVQVVPWTLIKDAGSANAFADAIEAAPRQLFGGGTSLSGAIDHAMLLLPGAPYRGLKRVIDVSGDGSNNRGRDVREARDEAVRAGVGMFAAAIWDAPRRRLTLARATGRARNPCITLARERGARLRVRNSCAP